MKRTIRSPLTFLALLAAGAAYIDPGTGSFLLQILVGGFVAVAFAIKMFWRRIKNLFVRGSSGTAEAETSDKARTPESTS